MSPTIDRVARALSRRGLFVEREGLLVRVRNTEPSQGPPAEVLLPADHPLDGKALRQLVDFASVSHPAGGRVEQAFATPDFHPGSSVPVGCVLATTPDQHARDEELADGRCEDGDQIKSEATWLSYPRIED